MHRRARHPPPGIVADRLHSAAIHVLRQVRREDQTLGIGPAALSALSMLVFGGPRPLTALAAAEQVRPPTMSRIVTGLVRAGLAQRRPHRRDGRSRIIAATARGRAVVRRGRRRRVAALARLLAPLGRHHLATIGRAVALVEAALAAPAQAR